MEKEDINISNDIMQNDDDDGPNYAEKLLLIHKSTKNIRLHIVYDVGISKFK